MLEIIEFEHKGGYKIFMQFNSGESGVIDMLPELENEPIEVIRDLLDTNKFKNIKLNYGTLCWGNEVDIAPEYLYDVMIKQNGKIA